MTILTITDTVITESGKIIKCVLPFAYNLRALINMEMSRQAIDKTVSKDLNNHLSVFLTKDEKGRIVAILKAK